MGRENVQESRGFTDLESYELVRIYPHSNNKHLNLNQHQQVHEFDNSNERFAEVRDEILEHWNEMWPDQFKEILKNYTTFQ